MVPRSHTSNFKKGIAEKHKGQVMNERQDMQKKPNSNLRDLLKKAKTRKLSELSKTEQNRLAKLNGMFDGLIQQNLVLSIGIN